MNTEKPWIPNLSKKQIEIFNARERYVLVCGPRMSGKTLGVIHRVVRHLWEVPGARVALVCKTNKNATEGGVWKDLTEIIMPEWLNANICGPDEYGGHPLEYTTQRDGVPGPRIDPNTRVPNFRIRNYWGGESEILQLSLDNDQDVETKFKGTRFSMIWVSELSEFKMQNVFKCFDAQVRASSESNQQLIFDTNPAAEGTDSWIYKLWWIDRNRKDHPQPHFQAGLRLIEVFLEDNPWLTQAQIERLKGANADNAGEYDRNVLGKWTKGFGTKGKLFSDIFVPSTHVISPAIDVSETTGALISGWDMGQVNSATALAEKRMIGDLPIYNFLDEVVCLDEKISTEEFTLQVLDKMLKLHEFYNRDFEWTHWSDDTALNVWRAGVEGYDATIVLNASSGIIDLQAVDKASQSVETGIKIIRRAIREDRIFVGENCPHILKMLSDISEGKNKPVDDTELKHIFDAFRYIIYMEERRYRADTAPRPRGVDRSGSLLVSI